MAPKNGSNQNSLTNSPAPTVTDVDESDLQEIDAVNESLDELSSALDSIENRTDNIMAQLLELLNSNKEIRQQLAAENARNQSN